MKLTVLSVGGSIISPDKVDYDFLSSFRSMIISHLESHQDERLIFVAGGGAPARIYQDALRRIMPDADPELQDMLGIKATHLNAMLLKAVFSDFCTDDIVTDPTDESVSFSGRILVAGGWKPGFSTDTDAVSNIKKVYTADPKKDPNAKPIDSISWKDFRAMVGDEWNPGLNAPFDPIASKLADEDNMIVIAADGRNIENTKAILEEKPFEGTIIGA